MTLLPWYLSGGLFLLLIGFLFFHILRLSAVRRFKSQTTEELQYELHEMNERLLAIHRISEGLCESKDLESILQRIIDSATNALNADIGCILLYKDNTDMLETAVSKGVPINLLSTIDEDEPICGWVAQKKTPLLINDLSKSKKFSQIQSPLYRGPSVMAAPIISNRNTYGVININAKTGNQTFTRVELLTLTVIASQAAIVIENAKTYQELRQSLNETSTLYKLTEEVNRSLDLKKTLTHVAEMATEITGTDACSLRLLDEKSNTLNIQSTYGLSEEYKSKGELQVGEGVGGYVAKTGKPITISNLRRDDRIKYTEYLQNEGLLSLVSVPIKTASNTVIGIISVYRKTLYQAKPNIVKILSFFANSASVAIQNAKLFLSLESNYYETIQSLARTIEARDSYTRGHSERVAEYSLIMAEQLNLSQNDIELTRYAAQLHDIGKISIPDRVLTKPGKLTTPEYENIKTHPEKGAEMIQPLEFLKETAPIIKHHHEFYNGTGYPDGLSGEDIPLISRIISVADAFDAMTSNRTYREPMSVERTLKELHKCSGTQFDPGITEIFIQAVEEKKIRVNHHEIQQT